MLKNKEKWEKVKEELKERYATLTDKDLNYKEGEEEKLFAMLQEKTGKTKSELKTLLRDLSD